MGTLSLSCHRTLTKSSIPPLASASICRICGPHSTDIMWSPRNWGQMEPRQESVCKDQRAVGTGPRRALPGSAPPGSADLEVRFRSPPSASLPWRIQCFERSLHQSTYSSRSPLGQTGWALSSVYRWVTQSSKAKAHMIPRSLDSFGRGKGGKLALWMRVQVWRGGAGAPRLLEPFGEAEEEGRLRETADKFASIMTASSWPRFCPLRNSPGFTATRKWCSFQHTGLFTEQN